MCPAKILGDCRLKQLLFRAGGVFSPCRSPSYPASVVIPQNTAPPEITLAGSNTWVAGNEPRPLFVEGENGEITSEEKLREIHVRFGSNAGSSEVKGSTLTTAAVVAKNPNYMREDLRRTVTFSVDGGVLTTRSGKRVGL